MWVGTKEGDQSQRDHRERYTNLDDEDQRRRRKETEQLRNYNLASFRPTEVVELGIELTSIVIARRETWWSWKC